MASASASASARSVGQQSQTEQAVESLRESLRLDPCGAEAAEGRVRLAEAFAQLCVSLCVVSE